MHTFKRERAHQEAAGINETFDAPGVMSADDVMAFYKRHPDYAPGGYWDRQAAYGITAADRFDALAAKIEAAD